MECCAQDPRDNEGFSILTVLRNQPQSPVNGIQEPIQGEHHVSKRQTRQGGEEERMQVPVQRIAQPQDEHQQGLNVDYDAGHQKRGNMQIPPEGKPETQRRTQMKRREGHT